MDAKITKERLSRMLSYDWLKIVGIAAAAIVVWMLVFTMTATRITVTQQFTVVNYYGNVATTNTKFSETLSNALDKGVFSYEILETTEVDAPGSGEYAGQVLEARFSTHEGDLIFVPDIIYEDTEYEVNGEKKYDTYVQHLVKSYGAVLMNLDPEAENGYFKQLEAYLNGYYDGGYENGTLNEAKVEADFRARVVKDKRYKKEAQLVQGVTDDIARIEKYRAALIEFYGYLESGLVQPTKTVISDPTTNEVLLEGVYSINLCPDKETMGGLSNVAAYLAIFTNDAGEEKQALSAENMNVALFDFSEVEEGFQYEGLLYINYVIRTVKTA